VRVHSECLTGDGLGSLRCDCGPQLRAGLAIAAAEGGLVIYLGGHEGRGIGLLGKLAAYALQDDGRDTVQANLELGYPVDGREYGAAAAILHDLGVDSLRLLTNNPDKVLGLRAGGIEVVSVEPLESGANRHNLGYLRAKRDQLGHSLRLAEGGR
ncbi:MAG: GTP cyclohydrolase II, partial [Actinobacteria bacterium]|nr:GTP cyclohydrolase II [Actinomycetota bacterium]